MTELIARLMVRFVIVREAVAHAGTFILFTLRPSVVEARRSAAAHFDRVSTRAALRALRTIKPRRKRDARPA